MNVVGASNVICGYCQMPGHSTLNCQFGAEQMEEEVDAISGFGQRKPNDPYASSYNPGWRNHPNFSYRNNQDSAGSGSSKPRVQESKLESLLKNFVESQTKQNEEFRQHGKLVTEAIKELTSKVDHLTVHSKMLETQIANKKMLQINLLVNSQ